MADNNLNDIRKLDPWERLEKLKKLEKEKKEEMDKAKQMIDESMREIEIHEEMRDIPIPQVRAVNIDQLFSPEEKEVFKMKRFESASGSAQGEEDKIALMPERNSLEETVAAERAIRQTETGPRYGGPLDNLSAADQAQRLIEAYDTIKSLEQLGDQRSVYQDRQWESYQQLSASVYESGWKASRLEEEEKLTAAERLLFGK